MKKKPVSEKFKLRGWDWSELGILWGFREGLSDKVMARKIRKHIWDCYGHTNIQDPKTKQVATDIRKFLKLLSSVGCSAPIWKGMRAIKDDFTLFQFTDILLECMWN